MFVFCVLVNTAESESSLIGEESVFGNLNFLKRLFLLIKEYVLSFLWTIIDFIGPWVVFERYLRFSCFLTTYLSTAFLLTLAFKENCQYDFIEDIRAHNDFLFRVSRFHFLVLLAVTLLPLFFKTSIKEVKLFESSEIWIGYLFFLSFGVFKNRYLRIFNWFQGYYFPRHSRIKEGLMKILTFALCFTLSSVLLFSYVTVLLVLTLLNYTLTTSQSHQPDN